jgi:NADPH-dependent 2,4-dienoyl-CoA reductase/sulfur reductase-like enzyme
MNCRRIKTEIVVIGAGPAGLAAAAAARRSGADVVLVDAFSAAGGQYFMQPLANHESQNPQVQRGKLAIAECEQLGVQLLNDTEIFAAYPGFALFATNRDGPLRIECKAIIAATGAHDRTMPFPGWTLPGVMTAGAGQRMAKVNGVLPGKRIVVAGSGPFLFAVAESLIAKGASIVALIEARTPNLKLGLHLAQFPENWNEAFRLARTVRRHVSRLIFGKMITEAFGKNCLEGVRLAKLDRSKAEQINGVDALLISHGFQPSIELTCILGCSHRFNDELGGWFVEADGYSGQTSVEGVFAAGEVLGVAGAKPAIYSGELAGSSAAKKIGLTVDQDKENSVRLKLRRARQFGHGLGMLFSPATQFADVARDDTVLCRCEEVTCKEIREACIEGASSAYSAKIWTRAGMGRCQGRICRMGISQLLAQETGRTLEEIGFNKPRVPIRPTAITDVLSALTKG